jgi:membrane fusion protein, multidrug efflux system
MMGIELMGDRPCRWRILPPGLFAVAACLLVCATSSCGTSHTEDAKAQPSPREIPSISAEVLVVQSSLFPAKVRAQGSLVADEVTVVGAKVAGRVADVHVDVGDVVAKGAPLVSLDRSEFQLEVSLAQAQLVQARAALGLNADDPLEQLVPEKSPPVREARAVWDESKTRIERLQRLRLKNAATQEDVDQAVAAERVAEARHASAMNGVLEKIAQIRVRSAELALAQQRLDDTAVVAPFDGQVQERHVAHGSFVPVGQSIVTLVRTSTLRFRGTMPERSAQRLALGQEVSLTIESVSGPITGKITRISPVVLERNRSLMFEVELPNADGRLRTGLFAEAAVVVDPAARAILVPPSSVVEFAGTEKVWKVVEGVAREQVVETSHRSAEGIEITSGLAEGDVILRDASRGRVARIQPTTSTAESSSPPSSEQPAAATAENTSPPQTDPPQNEPATAATARSE